MEMKVLYRLIDKIIIPKYPWIEDFVWVSRYYAGTQYYDLEVYVDPKTYPELPDNESTKLEKDLISLFRAVGPPAGVFFGGVIIFAKD